MPTIRQLNQRHPSCDDEIVANCRALYAGGKDFRARLTYFLPPRPAEPWQQYTLRQRESHYQNYLGPIVDYFAAMLFTSRPQPVAKRDGSDEQLTDPGDYYNQFRDDCDRVGTDIDSFFKGRFTEAMVTGKAWTRVHQFDDGNGEPLNRADYENRKLGDAWLSPLDIDEVYDWEVDDAGNIEWAIVHHKTQRREGPGGDRSLVKETWEFLTEETVETFEISYDVNNPPSDKTEVLPLGPPVQHRFGAVPLFCIELPIGLWVANRIESAQIAHFRLSNAQAWGLSRTCYAMPVYKVKNPDQFNARMGVGYGITVEPDEDVTWVAPPGAHFEALANEVTAHKDEIFRIAHQMALGVENNAHTVGRTAESKIADSQATRVILVAYAKEIKEQICRIYNAISGSREDGLKWSINGLDEIATADLQGFLTALQLVNDKIGGIPSKTANIQIKTKLAEGLLPELDQATRAIIREEITESIENEPDPAQAEIDNQIKLHTALAKVDAQANTGAKGAAGGSKPQKAPSGGKRSAPAAAAKA